MNELLKQFKQGDRKACSRVITLVENEDKLGIEILKEIYAHNDAYRVGITGPPGVGKSTMVNSLLSYFSRDNKSVGVIAVDPSSPFTGGAILGDRLRMQKSYEYDNVFVRSVASRGSLGGLSSSTDNISTVMSAFGMNTVLIETVGVGQSELDIMEIADTVVVVLVPESGDSIQAMKAGIMEIGDVFVVNKADREGADRAVTYINSMLSLKESSRTPAVVKTSAKREENIEELYSAILEHREYLERSGEIVKKRKMRKIKEVKDILRDMFIISIDKYTENIEKDTRSPYEIAQEIFKKTDKKDMEEVWKRR